jgi:hypothetical protein
MVEYCRAIRVPRGVVLTNGLQRPSALWGAMNGDCFAISILFEAYKSSLLTCADADAGAVCICLAPLAAGIRPSPFHEILITFAIVGHISVVAKSVFYMTVSWMSMTHYQNPWQLTETAGARKAMMGVTMRRRPRESITSNQRSRRKQMRRRWVARVATGSR